MKLIWVYLAGLIMSLCFSLLVFFAGVSLSKKSLVTLNLSTPFECGITVLAQASKPVSLRFFLLSVVFLVFDVELLILYPVFLELLKSLSSIVTPILLVFLVILTLGILWEWSRRMLEWNK